MVHLCLLLSIFISIILGSSQSGVIECDTNSDCIEEATCTNNLCECEKGYVFSIDGTKCLQYSIGYKAECEDDAQCSWLMGKYYCNSGYCECESGYKYLNGFCVLTKGLGETCSRDEECHITNDMFAMRCSDGVCECNNGYYARGDYDCRPAATSLGDNCALDSDCQMDNAYCYIYQCTSTETVRNLPLDNYIVTETGNTRSITTYELGISCTTNDECEDVENAICSPLISECICRRGYFYDETYGCVGEIGQDVGCTADSDCKITPRKCLEGACVCPVTHYHNEDLTKCIRTAYTPLFTCTDQIACHIYSQDAYCVADSDNIFSYCACPLNTFLNDDYICEAEEEDGNVCETNQCVDTNDCVSIVNSICSNNVCVCPDNFRLEGSTCLPNIGGECDDDAKPCELEYASCEDSLCVCNSDYTAIDETTCLQSLSGLHDDCTYDIQCSDIIENSVCSNDECTCSDGYTEKDDECFLTRGFGDYCDNVEQCKIVLGDNIQCRNSYCQCAADMVKTTDGLNCQKSGAETNFRKSYAVFIIYIFILFTIKL